MEALHKEENSFHFFSNSNISATVQEVTCWTVIIFLRPRLHFSIERLQLKNELCDAFCFRIMINKFKNNSVEWVQSHLK